MAGFFSTPIAATALTSNGTAAGVVGIASVTGWQQGSQAMLTDSAGTVPQLVIVVGINVVSNLLILQAIQTPSSGWIQTDSVVTQTAPPGLNKTGNVSDMSAWTTAHTANIAQVSSFIYQNNGVNGPV